MNGLKGVAIGLAIALLVVLVHQSNKAPASASLASVVAPEPAAAQPSAILPMKIDARGVWAIDTAVKVTRVGWFHGPSIRSIECLVGSPHCVIMIMRHDGPDRKFEYYESNCPTVQNCSVTLDIDSFSQDIGLMLVICVLCVLLFVGLIGGILSLLVVCFDPSSKPTAKSFTPPASAPTETIPVATQSITPALPQSNVTADPTPPASPSKSFFQNALDGVGDQFTLDDATRISIAKDGMLTLHGQSDERPIATYKTRAFVSSHHPHHIYSDGLRALTPEQFRCVLAQESGVDLATNFWAAVYCNGSVLFDAVIPGVREPDTLAFLRACREDPIRIRIYKPTVYNDIQLPTVDPIVAPTDSLVPADKKPADKPALDAHLEARCAHCARH